MLRKLIVISAVALSGCATTGPTFEDTLNSKIGIAIKDDFIRGLGPPQSSGQLSDGGEVWQYDLCRNTSYVNYYTKQTETARTGRRYRMEFGRDGYFRWWASSSCY